MELIENAFKSTRVLVTGHTGFKGAWLTQMLLELGANVAGIALPPATEPSLFHVLRLQDQIDHNLTDVRDPVATANVVARFQPEIIFHLAAQPLVRLSYEQPQRTFDTNVMGVVNLLESLRSQPSARACVVITSDKCYENREWVWSYRESDELGGYDPYSSSKAAAELVVASYRRSFFEKSGCHIATVRAGNVIGGGDWAADRLIPDCARAIMCGDTFIIRNPKSVRPWQHVLDPLRGYLILAARLMQTDGASFSEAWNFGPSEEVAWTTERIAEAFFDAWGRPREMRLEHSPEAVHEAGSLRLDSSKARTRLGWQGVWDIDTAVQETARWYRAFAEHRDMPALTSVQIDQYWRTADPSVSRISVTA